MGLLGIISRLINKVGSTSNYYQMVQYVWINLSEIRVCETTSARIPIKNSRSTRRFAARQLYQSSQESLLVLLFRTQKLNLLLSKAHQLNLDSVDLLWTSLWRMVVYLKSKIDGFEDNLWYFVASYHSCAFRWPCYLRQLCWRRLSFYRCVLIYVYVCVLRIK